ncbi:M24 family metallopeptidase [Bradyrhizobium ganzhouense]|uniref:M24 family metallopeptidase n=1 Tax=Bradyrhizobium ganzhouense TaxID=1179767 RepID=UPI003CF0F234
MTATFQPIPLTGLPFPRSEYERRQQKVFEAVARAELDALLVTSFAHLQYLSGYDGAAGAYFAPFPLIMMPGRAPTYVVREYDENAIRACSCIEEIAPYTQRNDFAKVCAEVLRRYGLQGKKVGFELGGWNLAPADVSALQAELPELKITDATSVIHLVKAVKSELELAAIREAMVLTDLAVDTFQRSLRGGVTEAEVAAAMEGEVRNAGGRLVFAVLGFGERTRLPHVLPANHPISMNEPALMEVGGTKQGYSAGLCRGAVLGRHSETESLYPLAVGALEAAIAAIKPGVTTGEVDAAARKLIERSGRSKLFRHRTGYATGPAWSGGRGNLSLEPGAADVLETGMTFHMPLHLFSESGYIVGCSEHIVVTKSGAEILSRTPHALYRA